MNNIEDIVCQFVVYGRKALDEQEAELKKHNDTHLISGKLARFTIFNAHLNKLKQKLDRKLKVIQQDVIFVAANRYTELDNALKAAYADLVNEYLTINFVRDDHEVRNEQDTNQPTSQPVHAGAFK